MVAVVVAGDAEVVALAAVKILDFSFIYLCHYHSQQTFIKSFLIYRSRSQSASFSSSFAGLPPTFSFYLSFSCSIFQICGHDNQSKLNTLDKTGTEPISAFYFRLY